MSEKPIFNFKFNYMPRKIIRVITIGGLGDVLLSTPSFKALKENNKNSKIIVHCTSPAHMEVFRHNPYVDSIRNTSFFSNMVPYTLYKLNKLHFGSIAYGRFMPTMCYNNNKNATEIIAEMLGATLEDKQVQVYLTPEEESKAISMLAKYKNPVIMHITSLTSKNQEWPLKNWEELIRQMPDYTFLQVGLSNDEAVTGAVDLRGKTRFREALAILKHAVSFVGVVSSFAHATNAFGTPGVVLFGASTPAIWGHANNINIYKELHCAPCIDLILNHECPYGKPCMNTITVEEVKSAILKQTKPAAVDAQSNLHYV